MKRVLALLLVLTATFSMFCACAKMSGADQKSTATTSAETSNTTAVAEKAPAAKNSGKIKLGLMVQAADDVRIGILNDYILKNFDKEFPDCELEVTTISGLEDSITMMKTYNATGDLGDVFWSDAQWAPATIASGAQMDLSDTIEKDGFVKKWNDTNFMKFDGHIYALQPGSDASYFPEIYYDKTIFEKYKLKVPTTLDELYAVCDTLVANKVVPFAMDNSWIMTNILFQNLLQAQDPSIVQKLLDNKTDYSDPTVLAAFQQLNDMLNKGYFGDRDTIAARDIAPAKEVFAGGQAAMMFDMYWDYTAYDNGHVSAFPWPSSNSNYPTGSVLQVWGSSLAGYAVNANSKNLNLAIKLAEYCCDQEAQYHNDHGTATVYNTGKAVQQGSALQQELIGLYNAAKTKQMTLSQNTMDPVVAADWKTLCSAFLAGQYTPEEMAKQWSEKYAANTYFK